METTEGELKVLMIASLDGDGRAYRALLGDLRLRLSAYLGRRLRRDPDDVEDLVQDCLIALHTRRHTYDRNQPFTPWFHAIARYKLIDHYRRTGRRQFVPIDDVQGALTIPDGSAASDARRDVEAALATLPEHTRALLRDVKINELSMAEAGERAGLSEGAAKVAVHRGLRAMMGRFAEGRRGDD